ncbi:MAG TPA: hypothetical protein VH856_09590 [Steroidobacteraceae bacterium]|jgi:hypothetical protein
MRARALVSAAACLAALAAPGAPAQVGRLEGLQPRQRIELGQVLVDRSLRVPDGVEIVVTAGSRVTLRRGAVLDLTGARVIAEPGNPWIDAGGALVPALRTTLAAPAAAGAQSLQLADAAGLGAGDELAVASGAGRMHVATVTGVGPGARVTIAQPLVTAAAAGQAVSGGEHRLVSHDPARGIDGGRIVFDPSQEVSASWYLAGARDFGLAVSVAAAGLRAQAGPQGDAPLPTLRLHGRHRAQTPGDLTGLGSEATRKLIVSDAHVIWAPSADNAPYPFLDFTDTRAITVTGRLVIEGSADAVPQRGVQFARATLPSHSGLHDLGAIELTGRFSVAAWIYSQAENNFARGNSIRNGADNGVALSFNRDVDPGYSFAPRSKFRTLNRRPVSFNFARSMSDLVVFAQGDDAWVQGSPKSAAIVLEGVTRATLENVYVASNVAALWLRASAATGPMTAIRVTDLQQHGRPNLPRGNPQAAVVIQVSAAEDRIDGLILSVSRDSATGETVRIVGDGTLAQPTIHLRASTGGLRATGRCVLLGAEITVENPRATVNLASCRQVTGVIRTPNPQGVSLPPAERGRGARVEDTGR